MSLGDGGAETTTGAAVTTAEELGACVAAGLLQRQRDVVLLLDSSSSLGAAGWAATQDFAVRFLRGLEGPGQGGGASNPGALLAVVSFSTQRSLLFDFAASASSSVGALEQVLRASAYLNAGTRTGRAVTSYR